MKYRYLTLADRQEIERLYRSETRFADIADAIGVKIGTIYREIENGSTGKDEYGRPIYSADAAERAFVERLKRRGRKPASREVCNE
ncbi:MAG: helix-turn-helix domain-containing protein [Oscillospiraceae bacterium]|nr:helix-turn-helix domain-containing protein [Oscillospiraceae bacterium]